MRGYLSNLKFSNRAPGDLVKNFLVFGLLVLFAYQVGTALLKTTYEFTLGSLARNMLPALAIGVFLAFILILDTYRYKELMLTPPHRISLKQLIFCVFTVVILGFGIPWSFLSIYGLTTFMIIFVIFIAFLLSLYFAISEKGFYAILIFLIINPFISYLEMWFTGLGSYSTIKTSFQWGPIVFSPTTVFLLVLLFASSLHFSKRKSFYSPKSSVGKAILIFFLISLFSSLLSTNPLKSLRELNLELLFPLILFFLILKNFRTEKQIKLLVCSLIGFVVLVSLVNLYFFIRGFGQRYQSVYDIYGAPLASQVDSSVWGTMIMAILPISIVSFIVSSRRMKIVLAGIIVFLLISLILSFSRTSLFASIFSFWILMMAKQSRRLGFVILFLVFLSLVFYKPILQEYILFRFQNITSFYDIFYNSSMQHRLNAWAGALNMIKDYPLLGIGTGLWGDYVHNYVSMQPVVGPNRETILGYIATPHNYYLKVATSSGIIGLVAFLYLLITLFREGIHVLRVSDNKFQYYLALGSISSLSGWMARFFTDDDFFLWIFMGPGFVFWILVAIIIKLRNLEQQPQVESANMIRSDPI